MAGVVVTGSSAIGQQLAFYQNAVGTALSPFDSWLLLRGIKTLALRLERQQSNAGRIARYLAGHPLGFRVHYPELEGHPGREVHFSQSEGSGGVISFEAGSADLASKIVETTEMFEVTVSFGGVVSSIGIPALMSHASIPADAGDVRKVPPDLVRVSAGIEHPDDLIEDLDKALVLATQATLNKL
jgi:cystathionine beta-lyase